MEKLCAALSGLLGMDSLKLSADGDAPEDVVTKINNLKNELPGLRQAKTQHDAFAAKIRDGLKLGADADESTIVGTLAGLQSKATSADNMQKDLDALKLDAENGKRQKLIDSGVAEGKLSNSMLEWAGKQDCIALSAFLKVAPVVVPLDKTNKDDLPNPDTIALSAEDKEVCRKAGISEDDFLAQKKANNPA